MRVRIYKTPTERELDGVRLDAFLPGTVRDVSPSIATWLITQGYAELEMRRYPRQNGSGVGGDEEFTQARFDSDRRDDW